MYDNAHLGEARAQQLHVRVGKGPHMKVVGGLFGQQGVQGPASQAPPDELHLRDASVQLQGCRGRTGRVGEGLYRLVRFGQHRESRRGAKRKEDLEANV